MRKLLEQIQKFVNKNTPVIIVNTSTNSALLFLNPEFEIQNDLIYIRFNSLNERGNSVFAKALQGTNENTIYLENEEENILMLQKLTLENYNHYIKANYSNTKDFSSELELRKEIQNLI